MGIEDILGKGKELFEQHKDTIDDALHSEQAETISDNLLDGAAGVANKATGGKFEEQVGGVRDTIDKSVGTE